jgi:hypothetical protein
LTAVIIAGAPPAAFGVFVCSDIYSTDYNLRTLC